MPASNKDSVEANFSHEGRNVKVNTTPDNYEQAIRKVILADPEGGRENVKNPFHRYPDLLEPYLETLFQNIKSRIEDTWGMPDDQFMNMHYFCVFFEEEKFGSAANSYENMDEKLQDLVPKKFIHILREEGALDNPVEVRKPLFK